MAGRVSITVAFATATLSFCCGCASIVHGSKQDFPVNSEPRGARVFVDGKYQGTTPFLAKGLERSEKHEIRVEKDGYVPKSASLKPSLSSWALGNLVSFFVVGAIIDAANGSIYTLEPDSWTATLSLASNPSSKPGRPASPGSAPAPIAGAEGFKAQLQKLFDEGKIFRDDLSDRCRKIDALERLRKDGLLSDSEFRDRCRILVEKRN